jgi:hypothetical protein
MTLSLAAFQSGLGRALMGEDTCPIDPASAGFRFTAEVRRSWCEGRTMIAARTVLTLVPDAERRRFVAEYVDQGGGLAMFLPTENAAFLEFPAPRLPEPSHALSLCRMDQALTRARLASEMLAGSEPRTVRARIERAIRGRIEREAWGCIECSAGAGDDRDCGEPEVRDYIARDVPGGGKPGVRGIVEPGVRGVIDSEAWGCIERAIRGPVERGPHAALVRFHAEPEAVLRALHGAPPPPISEPAYPLLFAPGLPNFYRVATAEEGALWDRLPAEDEPPELVERLLAEGVVAYAD